MSIHSSMVRDIEIVRSACGIGRDRVGISSPARGQVGITFLVRVASSYTFV